MAAGSSIGTPGTSMGIPERKWTKEKGGESKENDDEAEVTVKRYNVDQRRVEQARSADPQGQSTRGGAALAQG